jgi:hypothetical protein|tara:strand:+ start:476 stop:976 length:501 start_codon:yes stop_codon:yes gene_type:complete
MWLVLKYNKSQSNLLLSELKNKIDGSINFYVPKIKIKKFKDNKLKIFEKEILDDYAFCYYEGFCNEAIIKKLKYLKGIKYLLGNCLLNQKEICSFINYCKINSNNEGFVKQSFFNFSFIKKGIFLSGPFTNMIFKVLENQKKKLKILVGSLTTTIEKDSNYLYRQL